MPLPKAERFGHYPLNPAYMKDVVWWPLYDFVRIERIHPWLQFFQYPMGQRDKTESDTDMYLAGYLPAENNFLVTGIRVLFIPDAYEHRGHDANDRQDLRRVMLHGRLRMQIQNRVYNLGGPLARYPACFPIYHDVSESFFRRAVRRMSLTRLMKTAYHEVVPVLIAANQAFSVSIHYDDRECATLNSPGRLGVILDGKLIRSVA